MRTLMTVVTLGAAGAGYVYLNRAPDTGEPVAVKSEALSLFDWRRDSSANVQTTKVSAQELFQQIHEHTQSILDDITSKHSGHSDAPVDDAFQRLQQVAQSVVQAPNSAAGSVREVSVASKDPIVPLPSLDELQRTAFDSDQDASDTPAIQPAQGQVVAAKPDSQKGQLEPTTDANRTTQDRAGDSAATTKSTTVTKTSQPAGKPGGVRTARAAASQDDRIKFTYEWKIAGKTTRGLPMHTARLGGDGTRTFVIAGFNGEDRTAVRWLELLIDEMTRRPELLKNNDFVFFRAANPDGLVQYRVENARGILINRNFPSRRSRPSFDVQKTSTPAGELETRVILDTLYSFRPRRVVHLSSTTGRSQVLYNKLAKSVALEMERSAKVRLTSMDTELQPGSIEDFSDGTLEAAVLSMRLSIGNDWSRAWDALQPHVVAAIAGSSPESGDGSAEQFFDPDRSPIPTAQAEPVARQTRRRGYEELPAPPE